MNESLKHVARFGALLFATVALLACGSGAPAQTFAPTIGAPTAPATPIDGAPTDAQAVCLAMTEPLLLAALQDGVSEPDYGDVAGSDGVYCYYTVAGNADVNVEAQVEQLTQDEFNSLAQTIGADTPYVGVGRSAFIREGSVEGGPGTTLLAWDEGLSVTIDLARDGDQAEMDAAAKALAIKLLTDL
jgi:hypothetical protein